jgi:outer membrane protein assembly factor BamB
MMSWNLPLALLTLTSFSCAGNDDWPQWRGPKRDGVSSETGLLSQWPAGGPPLAWKTNGIGLGYATVSVAQGRIFTAGDGGQSSYIHALDLDGKPLWSAKLGRAGERGGFAGPRGTPTVNGKLLFALSQFGDLVCVETDSGKERWRKNLNKDFKGQVGGWGYSESPLVDGDKVVCTPGGPEGTMVALNKETGELIWQSKEFTDKAEYASAIVEEISGVRQYIQFTGNSLAGVAPETGKLLWRAARKGQTATIPTPVFHDNLVYVTSGYGVGCNLFKISKTDDSFKAEELYANKTMVNHHGGTVRVGEYLYGHSDSKGWVCQEFKTGELVWSSRKLDKGSILCADGHLYLRSESAKGTIALIEATPQGYKETGRFDQPDRSNEHSWPHPVVAGGKLYIRDQDILLCYDVKKK